MCWRVDGAVGSISTADYLGFIRDATQGDRTDLPLKSQSFSLTPVLKPNPRRSSILINRLSLTQVQARTESKSITLPHGASFFTVYTKARASTHTINTLTSH